MAAVAILPADKPSPFSIVRYQAFRITEPGKASGQSTWPIDLDEHVSLEDAVAAAQSSCFHKDHLAVRETGVRLRHWASSTEEVPFDRVHLFAIKRKSRANYIYRDHQQRRVHDLYADPVCVIDAATFANAGPLDCDPNTDWHTEEAIYLADLNRAASINGGTL